VDFDFVTDLPDGQSRRAAEKAIDGVFDFLIGAQYDEILHSNTPLAK
jgi:hypothetical protein